jgi:hypothetical protein
LPREAEGRSELLDLGLLDRELRGRRLDREGEALHLDAVPVGELVGRDARELSVQVGDEALAGELLVRVGPHAGLLVIGLHARGVGLLLERGTLELDGESVELGLGRLELPFRVLRGELQLRIAEFEEDRAGLNLGAGLDDDALDLALGRRGNPADLLGDERAGASDLAEHRASRGGPGPQRPAVHGRRGRFESRERDRDGRDRDDGNDAIDGRPDAPGSSFGWALNIHDELRTP